MCIRPALQSLLAEYARKSRTGLSRPGWPLDEEAHPDEDHVFELPGSSWITHALLQQVSQPHNVHLQTQHPADAFQQAPLEVAGA